MTGNTSIWMAYQHPQIHVLGGLVKKMKLIEREFGFVNILFDDF